jgi:rubrerythrin
MDEIKHAENCFALASRHAHTALGPEKLSLDGILGAVDLESLVRETFEEGCVGETLAAVQAAEAHRVAGDETVRDVLAAIEQEESEHAALAFRILRWALSVDPSLRRVVRQELELAREREKHLQLVAMPADVDLSAWHHHGRLTPDEMRQARGRALSEVVEPCVEALLREPDAHQRAELAAMGA